MANHSSILAWRIPGTGEPGGLLSMGSLVSQMVKNLPAMWETWVQSLGWEDPLEKEQATHSSPRVSTWSLMCALQSVGAFWVFM